MKTVKPLPLPGVIFKVRGRTAFLITPPGRDAAGRRPWVWYAPTLPGLPGAEERWMFRQFLRAGMAVAGIDIGESFGSPAGRALFAAFYRHVTRRCRLSLKPALLARSRGGLMLYNWAAENPGRVAGMAGIYPVCNLQSWPGLRQAGRAYGLKAGQLRRRLAFHNPVMRLEPLARAGVPILHLHGDADTVVPLTRHSALLERRYRRWGGTMRLIVVRGRGHDMWPGWFRHPELVRFVIAQARSG